MQYFFYYKDFIISYYIFSLSITDKKNIRTDLLFSGRLLLPLSYPGPMQLIFFCSLNICKVTAVAVFHDSGIILNL